MEHIIRFARMEDASALAKLNREEMGYDYPEEKTGECLKALLGDSTHCILVAETGGEVIGYLHLEWYQLLYSDPMVNVMGIAVSAACRRQGCERLYLQPGKTGLERRVPLRSVWCQEKPAKGLMPSTKAWGMRATSSSGILKSHYRAKDRKGDSA